MQTNFAEVASTLFPGGEGRLAARRDPEDEEEQPGIEVELRPAGKKVQRLSLLSGGEKALGAISFLFALFLARPCPFYLLDEVEAALDDTNIGRFVELLRQLLRPRAVRRHHAPEADDGSRRRAVRRHDGRRRHLADRLAPPAARRSRSRQRRVEQREAPRPLRTRLMPERRYARTKQFRGVPPKRVCANSEKFGDVASAPIGRSLVQPGMASV